MLPSFKDATASRRKKPFAAHPEDGFVVEGLFLYDPTL